jgi:hypothetical protein
MIATNMRSVTNVPMFAGEAVHRDADRVGRHDRPERDLARVRGPEDPVVREAREHRLACLQDERCGDVPARNRLDLIPELRQPIHDVDPEQVEHHDGQRDAHQPGADLEQPAPTRGVAERQDGRGLGGSLAHRRTVRFRSGCIGKHCLTTFERSSRIPQRPVDRGSNHS